MTLEEKIGQLLIVHFNGKIANEAAKALIQKTHVGGFIYYNWANGLDSPEQVLNLSSGLQKLSDQNRLPLPLFIAIDQEGGVVARLTRGFTIFPGNKALGMTDDSKLAEKAAFAMGQELGAVGVNVNFAPVVDINSNPRNPVIGVRSFGDSVETVISFAENALQGYQRAGIITSIKHFPGHGDVELDSHQDLPSIKKSKQELQNAEFLPFKALAHLTDMVMTAHIIIPSIDPINCATLSKNLLSILRDEMGFEGVIISDSLVMEGLLKNCSSIDDAAVKALNAGCDILLLGGRKLTGTHTDLELTVTDIQRIHQSLVEAVRTGFIAEERINQAVERVLRLKNKYTLSLTANSENLKHLVNTQEHQLLTKKIASLAVKVTQNKDIQIALKKSKIALFAPAVVENTIKQTSLTNLGKETYSQFFQGLSPTDEEIKTAHTLAKKSDILIFCSYNAWQNSSQTFLIQSLLETKKPFILIVLRDPLDASFFPQANLVVTTFSPTTPSIQAAVERLYALLGVR